MDRAERLRQLEREFAELKRAIAAEGSGPGEVAGGETGGGRRAMIRGWRGWLGAATGVSVAAVLALVVLTSPWAGAHGGNANNLHSCVNSQTGAIRITNPSTTADGTGLNRACAANEVARDWVIGATGATGPAGSSPLILGGGTTDGEEIPAMDSRFIPLYHSSARGLQQTLPVGGTLSRLYGQTGLGPTNPGIIATVRKNNLPTAVTCTITSLSCSDLVNSVTFAAGDTVSVFVQNQQGFPVEFAWTALYTTAP